MTLPSLALLGQSLLSGIFIGALYGLLGLGLSLSWGMLRQINLAHFALAFLGAYLTYELASVGMDPLATLAVIVPCFFALGALMHWLLARFSVSAFNSLLVTFGLTAIIEALIQWIWTADFRRMESAYGEVKFRVGGLYVALPEPGSGIRIQERPCARSPRMRPSPPPSASTCAGSRSCSRASAQPLPALRACASRSATRWRRDRFTPGWAWCSPR